MRRALALLMVLLLAAACGPKIEEVKVRLTAGNCDGEALHGVYGIWGVFLRREPSLLLQACRDANGVYGSVKALEGKLDQLALEHIPEEGVWEFWVAGTGDKTPCCLANQNTPVALCGHQRNITFPLAGESLEIKVDCVDQFSSEKGPAAEAVKECNVGRPQLIAPPCGH